MQGCSALETFDISKMSLYFPAHLIGYKSDEFSETYIFTPSYNFGNGMLQNPTIMVRDIQHADICNRLYGQMENLTGNAILDRIIKVSLDAKPELKKVCDIIDSYIMSHPDICNIIPKIDEYDRTLYIGLNVESVFKFDLRGTQVYHKKTNESPLLLTHEQTLQVLRNSGLSDVQFIIKISEIRVRCAKMTMCGHRTTTIRVIYQCEQICFDTIKNEKKCHEDIFI